MTDSKLPLHQHQIPASPLVLGCMRFGGEWDGFPITDDLVLEGHQAVEAALEIGINHYDLADIYTRGKAEHVFGRILSERPGLREQIILQSNVAFVWLEMTKARSVMILPANIFKPVWTVFLLEWG